MLTGCPTSVVAETERTDTYGEERAGVFSRDIEFPESIKSCTISPSFLRCEFGSRVNFKCSASSACYCCGKSDLSSPTTVSPIRSSEEKPCPAPGMQDQVLGKSNEDSTQVFYAGLPFVLFAALSFTFPISNISLLFPWI